MLAVRKPFRVALAAAVACSLSLPVAGLSYASALDAQDESSSVSTASGVQPSTLESLGVTSSTPVLVFSDEGIQATGSTEGYTVEGTALTITAAGTYVLSGTCTDGSITVKKGAGNVVLALNGLDLTAATDATTALNTKASTSVRVVAVDGTQNTLTQTAHTTEKPKAALNASEALTLEGTGALTVNGTHNNGVKSDTSLTVEDGLSLTVNATNNGLAADGLLTVNGGTVSVTAGGDAIKANPETTDDETDGMIAINGGTLNLTAAGDGIQAEQDLTITSGSFTITTGGGHTATLASDASAKALKAGSALTVYDGTFSLDAADDAVHSNDCAFLLGGSFTIATGDDGAHADTSLYLGGSGSEDVDETLAGNLNVNITASYEGLEAGALYVQDGTINVVSSDDGLNAAGGSSSGTGNESTDGTTPGGGWGNTGGPGGRGGNTQPGGSGSTTQPGGTGAASSIYSLMINGGSLTVNAGGDGLDANGSIQMTGGNVMVYGAAAGSDNSALDFDTTCVVTGGTLFAVGSTGVGNGRETIVPTAGSQTYIVSTTSVSAGKYLNVVKDDAVLASVKLPKNISHAVYTSDEEGFTSSYKFSTTAAALEVTGTPESQSAAAGNAGTGSDSSGTGSGNSGSDSGSANQPGTGSGSTDAGSGSAATDGSADGAAAGTSLVSAAPQPKAAGTVLKSGTASYKVTSAKNRTVTFTGTASTASRVTVPATVSYQGITYKVTAIAAKAFANSKTLKSVVIGKNVRKIGAKAFYNCKKLAKITVKTKKLAKSRVGAKAFKGVKSTCKVKVPAAKKAAYKKIFRARGLSKKATVR